MCLAAYTCRPLKYTGYKGRSLKRLAAINSESHNPPLFRASAISGLAHSAGSSIVIPDPGPVFETATLGLHGGCTGPWTSVLVGITHVGIERVGIARVGIVLTDDFVRNNDMQISE